MKLKELLLDEENIIIIGDINTEVFGISYDSRKICKGDIFFALPGNRTDGKKYINEAITKGASVIITNSKCSTNITTVQVIVDNILCFMSIICSKFYNYPDRELYLIGVTGTNGKTTITYMIESIFTYLNIKCGVIGTINYRYKNKVITAINTTPQSADIFKIMREMLDNGVRCLVMEVSSLALSLRRVYMMNFDVAVFTNLTQDHLDFHKNMNNYFEAKFMLFQELNMKVKKNKKYAIINADDNYGKKFLGITLDADIKFYSILLADSSITDLKVKNVKVTCKGNTFDVIFNNEKAKIKMQHIGMHNVYNALAALEVAIYSGISFRQAVKGLNGAMQVPGRLERINIKNLNFEVIIDYAHTADALKNVLQALQEIKSKRIITVFGCGGERDKTKRPIMGKISVEMSYFVFITSDNPRSEDPYDIISDIESGISESCRKNYRIIINREIAIKEAIMMADKNDVVLIAGKGHETYQIIKNVKYHFNDIEIAKKYANLKNKSLLS
ncbi:MAG: UDP-N-acetylmuramoyl-L-alanyl-D-glutamate--2,6-diaminopimelate ligase [Endomicrobium sp.]|jgi:UDP-N-acetylmuramoyl-L-alanyl-D-glutamate--2,6-diaminopimelate ligase|nr:UDP-N-acetylmuramoyl-L-alanyl-D-glutamate--2,6-diaminopimelate ligase [Endomicrobium sp.]